MKLDLEFGSSLCTPHRFAINGIQCANKYDFGDQRDRSPETAEEYGCGDMQFTRIPATPKVLAKYGITEAEYSEVAERLEIGLSFGMCGWCV